MSATILHTVSATATRTPKSVVAGRVITAIAVTFMTMDVGMKLARVKEAIEGTAQLGFPLTVVFPLGLVELICLVLYVMPRTGRWVPRCSRRTSAVPWPFTSGLATRCLRICCHPCTWQSCCGADCICAMRAFAPHLALT